MATKLYLPKDATAVSLGADEVAAAIAAHAGAKVEIGAQRLARPVVARAAGRGRRRRPAASAYGPVTRRGRAGLFAAGFLDGGAHRAGASGSSRSIALFQEPAAPDLRARRHHRSGLASPTTSRTAATRARAARWPWSRPRHRQGRDRLGPARPRRRRVSRPASSGRPCSARPAGQKYVVCNADEGDSGTFSDRMLMEGDPFDADRGHDDRRPRGRRDAGLHLPALGVPARGSRAQRRRSPRRMPAGYLGGDMQGSGKALRARGARRRRRLHLRRGDLAAREPRRQARQGALAAAAAGDRRACSASPPSSTTSSPGQRADHPRARRRVLQGLRHGPLARHLAAPARRQHQARRARREAPSA